MSGVIKLDEKAVAATIVRADAEFKELGDGGIKGLKDRIAELETIAKKAVDDLETYRSLNVKEVVKEVEQMKARHDLVVRSIRNFKGGLHVPGIEDESFSLLKTAIAIKMAGHGGNQKQAFESIGAGKEFEIISSVRAKHAERIAAVKAGQVIGSDQYGGNFVPDQVIPTVIAAIYARSAFINLTGEGTQRVSVMDGLTGGTVKIPKFLGGMIAYWIGEEDTYAESQVKTGDVTMNPKKLGCLARITDVMKRLAGFGYDALFQTDFIRAMAKKLDWTVAYGSGSDNAPRGIVNVEGIRIYSAQSKLSGIKGTDSLAGANFQADWAGAELDFDGLDNMKLALEENDFEIDASAAFIGAPRYFSRVKQLKVKNFDTQTDGQPYLIGLPMIPDSRLTDLIGPFGKSTQIATTNKPGASVSAPTTSVTTKFSDVFYGNYADVVLGRWLAGIEIEDDAGKGAGFTSDATFIKSRMYCDLGYRHPASLVVCPDARVRA